MVRVSPFDSAGRRHTSFSSLEVMPEIDEDLSVEINPDDIKMEVYRASGAGGQKVNKTSSAVRLIHIPTGIVVSCQVERSQYQNRDVAMKMLISKLVEIKEREHLEKISDIKGEQKEITWGSQIRSYVFMPYTLVKDHRTGCEKGNISAVMDGDLDDFITAYLKALSRYARREHRINLDFVNLGSVFCGRCFFCRIFAEIYVFCERRPFFFRTSVVNLITVSHKTICACHMDPGQNFYYTLAEQPLTLASKLMSGKTQPHA